MPFEWETVSKKNEENIIHRSFSADIAELNNVLEFLTETTAGAGADERKIEQLLIVAEELFVNVAYYAYDCGGKVELYCILTGNPLCIHLLMSDTGKQFNPTNRTEEEAAQSVESLTPGGLGILMAKKMSDGMEYRYENGENRLYIRKEMV